MIPFATTFTIPINPNVLWALLGIAGLLFTIISLILLYHWIKFSFQPGRVVGVMVLYLSVSFALMTASLISLSYYHISI